mgnify:CR=1 FL=1
MILRIKEKIEEEKVKISRIEAEKQELFHKLAGAEDHIEKLEG